MYGRSVYSKRSGQSSSDDKFTKHLIMQHGGIQLYAYGCHCSNGHDLRMGGTYFGNRFVRRVIGHRSEHTERQPDQYSSLSRDSDI